MKKPLNFSSSSKDFVFKSDTANTDYLQSRKLLSGQTMKKNVQEQNSGPNSNNQSFETHNNTLSLNLDDSRDKSLTARSKDLIGHLLSQASQNFLQSNNHMRSQISLNNSSIDLIGCQQQKEVSFGGNDDDSLMMNLVNGNISQEIYNDKTIQQLKRLSQQHYQNYKEQQNQNELHQRKSNEKDFKLAYKSLQGQLMRQAIDEQKSRIIEDLQNEMTNESSILGAVPMKIRQPSFDGNNSRKISMTNKGILMNEETSQNNSIIHHIQSGKSRDSNDAHLLMFSEKDILTFIKEEELQENQLESIKNQVKPMPSHNQHSSVFQKLYNQGLELVEKRKEISQLKIDDNLSECTFKPRINPNQGNQTQTNNGQQLSARRTNDQFFQDMLQYQEKRKQKVEQQRKLQEEKELEECRPRSASKSKVLDMSNSRLGLQTSRVRDNSQDIHDRLFSQNLKNRRQSQTRQQNRENSFDPSLNNSNLNITNQLNKSKVTSSEITQKLYEDAIKRRVEKDHLRSTSNQSRLNHTYYKTSNRSNEVFASRLLKQIDRAFTDLDCLRLNSLSLDQFYDILCYLGYTGDDHQNKDRITQDAWVYLGGSQNRQISKKSLIIFIHALNNLYFPWMTEHAQTSEVLNIMQDQAYSEFYIRNEQEASQLHQKFFEFWEYRSKIKSTNNLNTTTQVQQDSKSSNPKMNLLRFGKNNSEDQNKYKPQINEKSQRLASQHLLQLKEELQQLNIPYNHQDLLIKKGQLLKQKQEQILKKYQNKELDGCTFKPQTHDKNSQQHRGKSVFEDLYGDKEQHRQRLMNRKDREVADIEFEKEGDQCSFKPNIAKSQNRLISGQTKQKNTTQKTGISLTNQKSPMNSCKENSQNSFLGKGIQQKSNFSIRHNKALQEKKLSLNQKISETNPFNKKSSVYALNTDRCKSNLKLNSNVKNEEFDTHKPNQQDASQSGIKPFNPYHRQNKFQDQLIKQQVNKKQDLKLSQQNTSTKSQSRRYQQENLETSQHSPDQQYLSPSSPKFDSIGNNQQNNQVKHHLNLQNMHITQLDFQKIPLLFLDVNLGEGKVSRLVFYEGDDAEQVADIFVNENKLDLGKKDKLLQALNYQLKYIRQNQNM
eukprot:403351425